MPHETYQTAEEKIAYAVGAGFVRSFRITNLNAAERFFWAFDHATLATGKRLEWGIAVAPKQTIALNYRPSFIEFKLGLYLASSMTQGVYTASGAADFIFSVDLLPRGAALGGAVRAG